MFTDASDVSARVRLDRGWQKRCETARMKRKMERIAKKPVSEPENISSIPKSEGTIVVK